MNTRVTKILTTFCMAIILLWTSGAPPAAASAGTDHLNMKYDVEYVTWDSCTNETIHWSGYIQWTAQETTDAHGGTHLQYHGHSRLTGISEETGTRYVGGWNENSSRELVGPGPWQFKDTNKFRLTAEGKGLVSLADTTWVTTISTSGEWSSYLADFRSVCR